MKTLKEKIVIEINGKHAEFEAVTLASKETLKVVQTLVNGHWFIHLEHLDAEEKVLVKTEKVELQ